MNQRIKRIRNNANLTQQEFAKKIGTSQNVLANWESGRRNPSASVINNICKTFGVNEDWLRDGTGEMFIPDSLNELDVLIEKYSLSSADRVLIEKYVNLKAESRETIIRFITDVVSTLNHESANQSSRQEDTLSTSSSFDLDIDSEVESYRRALELQKKAAAGSPVSYGIEENMGNNKIG